MGVELTATAPDEALAALEPKRLMDAAAAQERLDDFGDPSFAEGLAVLTDAIRSEARLNLMGLAATEAELVRILGNRLRFERDLKQHPQIRDEKVEPPIVILGLPRTGTSKLLRLVAADPGVQRLDTWRLLNPAPFSAVTPGEPDPRVAFAQEAVGMLRDYFPDAVAAHPIEACEPDEELYLMCLSFRSPLPHFQLWVPSYRSWLQQTASELTYEHFRLSLQYMQWQDGGARGRPWVLKTPCHMSKLPYLLDEFPDANLVYCHRHPREIVPSFCRLVEVMRQTRSSEIDLPQLGEEWLTYWAAELEENLRFRDSDRATSSLDVRYEEVRDNDVEVVSRVYDMAGRSLTPQAREVILAWSAENPINKHGRNVYSLERYGLTGAAIDHRFGAYIDRFFSES